MKSASRSRVFAITVLGGAALLVSAFPARADAPRPAPAAAPAPAPSYDALLVRHTSIAQRMKPESRSRLEALGRDLATRVAQPPPANGKAKSTLELAQDLARANAALLGDLKGADIEALAFVVLVAAAKSAEDDLRALLTAVKKTNHTKAQLRELLAAKKAGTKAPDAGADSLSELTDEQQLRLQMLLDRASRFEQAISNIAKKISDTQSSIAANIK